MEFTHFFVFCAYFALRIVDSENPIPSSESTRSEGMQFALSILGLLLMIQSAVKFLFLMRVYEKYS